MTRRLISAPSPTGRNLAGLMIEAPLAAYDGADSPYLHMNLPDHLAGDDDPLAADGEEANAFLARKLSGDDLAEFRQLRADAKRAADANKARDARIHAADAAVEQRDRAERSWAARFPSAARVKTAW